MNGTNSTWLIFCTCEIAVEWSSDLACVLTVHLSSYVITSNKHDQHSRRPAWVDLQYFQLGLMGVIQQC